MYSQKRAYMANKGEYDSDRSSVIVQLNKDLKLSSNSAHRLLRQSKRKSLQAIAGEQMFYNGLVNWTLHVWLQPERDSRLTNDRNLH